MKKPLILSLAVLTLLSFAACSKAREQADQLIKDTKTSYDKAAEEVSKVKDKTVETVNDIQNAAKEIKEATDAVKKVGD